MRDRSLEVIERRLKRLEEAVFGDGPVPNKKRPAVTGNFDGPTGGVRFLIAKKFFSSKRSLSETRDALAKNDYHYSVQAIQMALSRLSRRDGPLGFN